LRRCAAAGTIGGMTRSKKPRQLVVAVVAALSLCSAAPAAGGDDDRLELDVPGTCTGKSTSRLRVRAEDGRIRIEFRLNPRPRSGLWQVVVLHERRIVARVTVRAAGGGERIELRRTVPDWFGTDTFVLRATGPRNETCRASATV
jgi:hypothetical protein